MKIADRHTDATAAFVKDRLVIPLVTAINLAGVNIFKYTPGYGHRVTRVISYCRVKAGAVTAAVKCAARTAATVAFTTDTETDNALSGTLANVKGSSSEQLSATITTDGTGVLTNGLLVVEIRSQAAKT